MTIEIGAILGEWTATVERGKVREFARAVKDDTADEQASVAPPTFPVVLTARFIERLVVELLGLDRGRTVHGEQEYRYSRPLAVGSAVVCSARLVEDDVREGRRGGRMRRVVCEVEIRDAASGDLILVERSTALEMAGASA